MNSKNPQRKSIQLWHWAVATILIAVLLAPWLIGPSCPTHLVIATGQSDGAYFKFANQYKTLLAEQGITLEVRETAGSIENLQLLGSGDVDIAMVQGGTSPVKPAGFVSLTSLYPEPIWVFFRADCQIETLADLENKRVAIGALGSGVRSVALTLLADSGIYEGDAGTSLFSISSAEAASQLKTGQIDAAFFVIASSSSIVRDLMHVDGVRLLSIDRGQAYQRQHPFLSQTLLPEGVADFRNNKPEKDIQLVAATANLVAKDDLHHALVPLLLQTVEQVHRGSDDLLVTQATFPSASFTAFPLLESARRYFRSGPSALYRYFPFSVAAWLDRVKLFLLPLLTLMIPLAKVAPPAYRWRIRSKIYRWYRVLHDIDQELDFAEGRRESNFASQNSTSQNVHDNALDGEGLKQKLDRLEQELATVSVPLSYMEEFYNLRIHVSYVQQKLDSRNSNGKQKSVSDRNAA